MQEWGGVQGRGCQSRAVPGVGRMHVYGNTGGGEGQVEMGVSSLSFARSKIWAPGDVEGLMENDGG